MFLLNTFPDVSSELSVFLYKCGHQLLKLKIASVVLHEQRNNYFCQHLRGVEHIAVVCTHDLFVSKVVLQKQNLCHMAGMSDHILENKIQTLGGASAFNFTKRRFSARRSYFYRSHILCPVLILSLTINNTIFHFRCSLYTQV